MKSSFNILLKGVPEEVNIDALTAALLKVPGVVGLHDLHVWSFTQGKTSPTVHVVHEPAIRYQLDLLSTLQSHISQEFGIHHVTIQCELTPCNLSDGNHDFVFDEEGSHGSHAH